MYYHPVLTTNKKRDSQIPLEPVDRADRGWLELRLQRGYYHLLRTLMPLSLSSKMYKSPVKTNKPP